MTDAQRVAATYTAAADHFDTLPFWHEFGRRTVDRLQLAPGARVLDVCCGTGASALPAAGAVGPGGSVLGVDLTPALIAHAKAAAEAASLPHARFIVANAESLDFAPASFDALISVFGWFFFADMPAVLRRAAAWLAPGGAIAITSWGSTVLEPGERIFWDVVRREDPTLDHISPADRLSTPDALTALFAEAGLPAPDITVEPWRMPLATPDEFWPVILGTSNRGVLEALPHAARHRVRHVVLAELTRLGVTGLDMQALVAVARRP
jgi:ubiquinone/menaquinone biosynthesis C-methylase UbiE